MGRLAKRLTRLTALSLVLVAQVAVAPASCCLLRSAVAGDGPCCHEHAGKTDAKATACCHKVAVDGHRDSETLGTSHAPVLPGDCLWCSSGPKAVPNDRETVDPTPFAGTSIPTASEPIPAATRPVSSAPDRPPARSAIALCALLCVWRK